MYVVIVTVPAPFDEVITLQLEFLWSVLSSFSHMDFTITMVQDLVYFKPLFSIHHGGHGRRLYISASDIWFE
jgi:hypothetical protein